MCAWFFDITLSAVINAGRFDVGFYAGRVYGLMANGFVLAMLMLESSKLYARLIIIHDERKRATELAALDPLTGIANRRAFEDALDAGMAADATVPDAVVLVMIDLARPHAIPRRRAGGGCQMAERDRTTSQPRPSMSGTV